MRQWLCVSGEVAAAIEQVWAMVSAGDRVERWFSFVGQTLVHDLHEGGARTILLADGTSFEEHIILNDSRLRVYQYYVPAPPLPMRNVIGTMRFSPTDEGTRILWSVSYEPLEPPELPAPDLQQRYLDAIQAMGACARLP